MRCPLQSIFIALSPDLFEMLTLELGLAAGVGILIGGGAIAGLLGAALRVSPASRAARDRSRARSPCWSPACSRN